MKLIAQITDGEGRGLPVSSLIFAAEGVIFTTCL